jgi:hypothetical protein
MYIERAPALKQPVFVDEKKQNAGEFVGEDDAGLPEPEPDVRDSSTEIKKIQ